MELHQLSRRSALLQGGAAWATLAGLHSALFAQALPGRPGEETLQWLDQPPANPSGGVVVNLQPWETLTAAQTPTDKFFQVAHYDKPVIDEKGWKQLAAASKKWLAEVQKIEEGAQKRLKKPGDEHDLTDVGLVVLLFEALPISEAAAAHSNSNAKTRRQRVTSA